MSKNLDRLNAHETLIGVLLRTVRNQSAAIEALRELLKERGAFSEAEFSAKFYVVQKQQDADFVQQFAAAEQDAHAAALQMILQRHDSKPQ